MQEDSFYHIYNRANGNEKLFLSDNNYHYFLKQWVKYINPIAETYAYCLIPNHFHFVIKIRTEKEISFNLGFSEKQPFGKFQTFQKLLSKQFSNFFSSYTQAFNKMHGRKGSLFTPNFKKKIITDDEYLRQVILYVHLNPVKHQVTKDFDNYSYASFSSIRSDKSTLLKREEVIALFDDKDNFNFVHQQQKVKTELINEIIKVDN